MKLGAAIHLFNHYRPSCAFDLIVAGKSTWFMFSANIFRLAIRFEITRKPARLCLAVIDSGHRCGHPCNLFHRCFGPNWEKFRQDLQDKEDKK